jgi:hypothetical protein
MTNWTYNGVEFTDDMIGGNAGFVYRITCVPIDKKYIGKKLFTSSRKRKLACRTKGKVVEVGKKKTVRDRVDSNWRDYYGSSNDLLEDMKRFGKENFKREILQLAPSKGVLSYYELKHQMAEDALFRDDYYNGILNVRLGRNVFPKEMLEQRQ